MKRKSKSNKIRLFNGLWIALMAEIFSTPDDGGPLKLSDFQAIDAVRHQRDVANAEVAFVIFVAIMLLIFAGPRLWRRLRALTGARPKAVGKDQPLDDHALIVDQ